MRLKEAFSRGPHWPLSARAKPCLNVAAIGSDWTGSVQAVAPAESANPPMELQRVLQCCEQLVCVERWLVEPLAHNQHLAHFGERNCPRVRCGLIVFFGDQFSKKTRPLCMGHEHPGVRDASCSANIRPLRRAFSFAFASGEAVESAAWSFQC